MVEQVIAILASVPLDQVEKIVDAAIAHRDARREADASAAVGAVESSLADEVKIL